MAVDIGTGATITFGTSSYAAEILSINGESSRVVVDTSHMGTTGSRTGVLGDLVSMEVVRVNINYDPNEPPPLSTASETVTLTFPVPSGGSTGATRAGTAGITQQSYSVPLEDKMTGSYTITFLDDVTQADST